MPSFDLITKDNINIRSGPGMIYDAVGQLTKGTSLTSHEFRRNEKQVGWYKIDKGWVCAKYVTLAKDIDTGSSVLRGVKERRTAAGDDGDTNEVSGGGGNISTGTRTININGANGDEYTGDLILGRRIYGMPYQFLPTTDYRASIGGDTNVLGTSLIEACAELPILTVIPGRPLFLPDMNEDQRKSLVESMSTGIAAMGGEAVDAMKTRLVDTATQSILSDGETKYFTFDHDYPRYIRYVNTMCQACAKFMGIGNKYVPGYESEVDHGKYQYFNWARWTLANYYARRPTRNMLGSFPDLTRFAQSPSSALEELQERSTGKGALNAIRENLASEKFYTDFVINPNIGYSETFTNNTSESMIAGIANSASEYAKELGFLLNAGGVSSNVVEESKKNLDEAVNKMSGGADNIFTKVLKGATTVFSGANLVFPEIWKGSNFNRNYNIEMTLKTAYGDPESVFLNLYVPMFHWIALAAPIQNTVNSYKAPFLVRFAIPGICSVDMGIVNSLTITKGGDGSAWSVDGFPLEINLSISITDLYSSMMISNIQAVQPLDMWNFFWNNAFIDYLAVYSGLNMRSSELAKKLEVMELLAWNSAKDVPVRAADEISKVAARVFTFGAMK